jgi:hypothetical protein
VKRIALAVAGAAIVGLSACSNAAAPTAAHSAAPASHGTATPITPVSCRQQYATWQHGEGRGLITALGAVSAAGTVGDTQVLVVALKNARPAVARAARHPMPGCADPRGYWDILLMHVNAAAATGSSPSSVRAAMTGVPKIEHELTAELQQTTR